LALNYKATNEMVVISNFVTFVNSCSPEGATKHFLLHYPIAVFVILYHGYNAHYT